MLHACLIGIKDNVSLLFMWVSPRRFYPQRPPIPSPYAAQPPAFVLVWAQLLQPLYDAHFLVFVHCRFCHVAQCSAGRSRPCKCIFCLA